MLKHLLYGISLLTVIACLPGCEQIELYHHIFIHDGDEVAGEVTNENITTEEPSPPKDDGNATPEDTEMPDNPDAMNDSDSEDPGTTEENITTDDLDMIENSES